MAKPVIFGPAYSTYVRSVRLVLEEKGVEYDLREIDFLAGESGHPDQVWQHPWGKVPTFEHGDFQLYETEAIMRYCDLAFDGPSLQPDDPGGQGRMTQLINIVDSYAYRPIIHGIVVPRVVMPKLGNPTDEELVQNSIEPSRTAVSALDKLISGKFAVGDAISLADCHMLPVVDYMVLTEEGRELLAGAKTLSAWHENCKQRASAQATMPEL